MSRKNQLRNKAKSTVKRMSISGAPSQGNIAPVLPKKNTQKLPYIPFGDDNLFPQAMAFVNRKSGVHRGIMQKKVRAFTAKGFAFEENKDVAEFVDMANNTEMLRTVAHKYFTDKTHSGNAFIKVVKDNAGSFVSVFHHDYTECRVGANENEGYILLHPNWADYNNSKDLIKKIPIYPKFEEVDGLQHSIIHCKDYEPEFKNYGIPTWLAGLNSATIAYKTNKWNLSRLDHGARVSAILLVDGEFSSTEDEQKFGKDMDELHTSEENAGKILQIKKNLEGDNTRLIPFPQTEDADWTNLHEKTKEELLIAHEWLPAMAGFDTKDGFSTDRILNEYYVLLSTIISEEQESFLEVIRMILWDQMNIDATSLEFVNKPPTAEQPDTMFVWEERKQRGVDYDETDPKQQIFLAELKATRPIILQ